MGEDAETKMEETPPSPLGQSPRSAVMTDKKVLVSRNRVIKPMAS